MGKKCWFISRLGKLENLNNKKNTDETNLTLIMGLLPFVAKIRGDIESFCLLELSLGVELIDEQNRPVYVVVKL